MSSARGGWWLWPVAAGGVLVVEVGLGAVAWWLIAHTLPCVWVGAETLGMPWQPDLPCVQAVPLFGEAMWVVGAALSLLVLVAVAGSLIAAGGRLWRTRRLVAGLVDRSQQPEVGSKVARAAARAGLQAPVYVAADPGLVCFCAGLGRPSVVVSDALVARLSGRELSAVLAHESAHVRARDPLARLAARLLAGLLFFLPALRVLVERLQLVSELAADRVAERRVGSQPLASALYRVLSGEDAGTDPTLELAGLQSVPARIDRLVGNSSAPPSPSPVAIAFSVTAAVLVGALLVSAVPTARQIRTGEPSVSMSGPMACIADQGAPVPERLAALTALITLPMLRSNNVSAGASGNTGDSTGQHPHQRTIPRGHGSSAGLPASGCDSTGAKA